MSSPVVGLEIGAYFLRAVVVRHSYFGSRIVAINELPLEQSPWLKNGLRDKQGLVHKLKELFSQAKPRPIRQIRVISALPESIVFSKALILPKLKAKELIQTIPFEAAEFLPLPIEDMYLDWQVDSTPEKDKDGEEKSHVFVVAAPKHLVDELVDTLAKADLELVGLRTQPFAILDALNLPSHHKTMNALLNIDRKATTLVIANNAMIKLTATIPIGGLHLQEALPAQARALSQEIAEGISYYHNRLGEPSEVRGVFLTGPGAMIKGLPEALDREMKWPTQIGLPKISLPHKQPLDPRFASALGLAVGQSHINLLPHDHRQSMFVDIVSGFLQLILVIALVALIGTYGWLKTANGSLGSQIQAKQKEKTLAKQSLERANTLELKLQYLIDRQNALEKITGFSIDTGQLLNNIAASTPNNVQLTNIQSQSGSDLVINGIAAARSDITTFVSALSQIKELGGITLNQANTQNTSITFSLVMTLGPLGSVNLLSPSPGNKL